MPPRLRKAAEALLTSNTVDSGAAADCSHPLTRTWGNGTGRGRKCLLCKAELGTGDDKPDGGCPKGQARSRRGSQKDRLNELEECLEQIGQAEAEVRAAAALLDDAAKSEEGTRKAMIRTAKTKLMSHVTTHLDIAKNLLHGEKEKSPATAGQASRSG